MEVSVAWVEVRDCSPSIVLLWEWRVFLQVENPPPKKVNILET